MEFISVIGSLLGGIGALVGATKSAPQQQEAAPPPPAEPPKSQAAKTPAAATFERQNVQDEGPLAGAAGSTLLTAAAADGLDYVDLAGELLIVADGLRKATLNFDVRVFARYIQDDQGFPEDPDPSYPAADQILTGSTNGALLKRGTATVAMGVGERPELRCRFIGQYSQLFREPQMRVIAILPPVFQSSHSCRSESAEQRSALHSFRRLFIHGRRDPVSKCDIAVGCSPVFSASSA